MSDIDSAGPFGNPDGARADLADVLEDFVDFNGDPAYGALATRANDATVRVVAGKLGAGKTVHVRRLQEFQGRQDSVYTDQPQQGLPATEEVVRACQWFSGTVLEEKWTLLWNRAILRSVTSHLLRSRELAHHITTEKAEEIKANYGRLLGQYLNPRSIYGEVRDIINQFNKGHQLSKYLNDPLWGDLEYSLGEEMRHCPPVFFYLDGIDDEFSYAPMYWLQCQKGLFLQVMRLLRDPTFGGRMHVIVSLRDVVMSAVFTSEHAPKYVGEPHIRLLSWDRESLKVLLDRKIKALEPEYIVGDPAEERSAATWLGRGEIPNEVRGITEDVTDYILRHTRPIPRDVVSLGNALSLEARKRRSNGEREIPAARLREIVAQSARRFGDSQLAQCSNQIASDMMPADAARNEYAHVYTGPDAYIKHITDDLRTIIATIGVDMFEMKQLDTLRSLAVSTWGEGTDLPAVLWQNGLLGYMDRTRRSNFYSLGSSDQFSLPEASGRFVFHPCVIDSVGIASAGPEPIVPF